MMRFSGETLGAVMGLICMTTLPLLSFGSGDHAGGHGHGGSVSIGEPAEAGEADRTVRIEATDDMAFSPATVQVEKGKTVRFVIENVGQLRHSFLLGTPKSQRHHEQEMKGMDADEMASHMADNPRGMVIPPGQTQSLTWHFTQARAIQFACHIPGHYAAGMKGKIRVGH